MSQSFVELHFSITVICSIAALYHFFFILFLYKFYVKIKNIFSNSVIYLRKLKVMLKVKLVDVKYDNM